VFNPVCIPDVTKVTKTSMRLLQTSKGLLVTPYIISLGCRVYDPKTQHYVITVVQHFPRKCSRIFSSSPHAVHSRICR